MQRTIEAVIFDNDGTLVDSENITLSVLMEIAIEHGADVRDDDPHRFLGAHLQVVFDEIGKRAGKPLPDGMIDVFRAKQTRMINEGLSEMPGATELLEYLADRNMPMAVASNAPRTKMERCLNATNLARFFPEAHLISAYDVNVWKPAPDIFLTAANVLGVAPDRCAVVEDSGTGLDAANAAGMIVFALDQSGRFADRPSTTTLSSLPELINQLELSK